MSNAQLWERYRTYLFHDEEAGFSLDISRMGFDEAFLKRMEGPIRDALAAMEGLEGGAIANPDEGRMVGHYWLRTPERAPDLEIARAIRETNDRIRKFASDIQGAVIRGGKDEPFENLLLVGIGGSALGPQLVADALGTDEDTMHPYFLDNTDPDGLQRTLRKLKGRLDRTLTVVVSKSGGTPETRNGMVEARKCYEDEDLDFAAHAVAVTSDGSKLYKQADDENWQAIFPMWDWVGGRTSVTSAVGLLPAALQGIDIDQMLSGAAKMDELTRRGEWRENPAALLALMWHWAGGGRGAKDMVILPYKDRLMLFSKYLQQLVMESLGKENDLTGKKVNQGIAVYGNKGSTDQHAYVQQLRDGLNNFFATFIEVLEDQCGPDPVTTVEVEPGITSADYLGGLLLGTRDALHENGRESITITVRQLDAGSLGMMIALYERAVGLYATLVNVNAYHQPGVEAGKAAAASVLAVQTKLLDAIAGDNALRTAEEWAAAIDESEQTEWVYKLLERLTANAGRGLKREAGGDAGENRYGGV